MWIFTSAGFYSAVEHRDNPDLLMIRARDKKSLQTMVEGIELAGNAIKKETGEFPAEYVVDNEIYMDEGGSDYPWRIVVSKATYALWVQFEILSYLSYPNFKSELTKTRGEKWHDAAMKVWGAMLAVEDTSAHHKYTKSWGRYHSFTGGNMEWDKDDAIEGEVDAEWDYSGVGSEDKMPRIADMTDEEWLEYHSSDGYSEDQDLPVPSSYIAGLDAEEPTEEELQEIENGGLHAELVKLAEEEGKK